MIIHQFEIPKYKWTVYAYYGAVPAYKDIIITQLEDMGCKEKYIRESLKIIGKEIPNTGFTYSNYFKRESVVVVSNCSDSEQFMNTLVHEARHLQQHIQDTFNLSDYTEDVYYLIGYIVQIMYNKSKPLLQYM